MRWTYRGLMAYGLAAGLVSGALGQSLTETIGRDPRPNAEADANQTGEILGLAPILRELKEAQARRICPAPADTAELFVRQRLLEAETAAAFDIDGVLSEIGSERAKLLDLRSALQARRDRTVGYLNTGSFLAGSGAGVAVNAAQLGNSTAIPGDYLGVGSGLTSTILSLVALKKMKGPRQSVGSVANMLAPLFDEKPELNTYYPPEVMRFLESAPPGENRGEGTRLQQLKANWTDQGQIGGPDATKNRSTIAALTSSKNEKVKLSIDLLSNRIAMLGDVSAVVSLMKRDLGTLMRDYRAGKDSCALDR